jgi:hypothetical protein
MNTKNYEFEVLCIISNNQSHQTLLIIRMLVYDISNNGLENLHYTLMSILLVSHSNLKYFTLLVSSNSTRSKILN